jgi:hypothetical protein
MGGKTGLSVAEIVDIRAKAAEGRTAAQNAFLETTPFPEEITRIGRFPIGSLVEATSIADTDQLQVDYRVVLHGIRNSYEWRPEILLPHLRQLIVEDFEVVHQGNIYPVSADTTKFEF